MKAHWIIENFSDSEDYRDLIQAVKDSGRNVFLLGRHNHNDFDPSEFKENECIIVQGSIQMTKNIRDRLPKGCFPITYSNWTNYLCTTYYPILNRYLFNDMRAQTTVGELKKNKFDYYQRFGKEALIFIRPDSGEKTFSGQLLDLQDFDRFWTNALASSAEDTDIVFVSTPKQINGEWRFLCSKYHGGQIIGTSTYQYQGQRTLIPSAPVGATEMCHQVLSEKFFPDSVFCVDICQDADNNFWLLELTSFSSAGLYAMDKHKVVQHVSAIAEMEYRERV